MNQFTKEELLEMKKALAYQNPFGHIFWAGFIMGSSIMGLISVAFKIWGYV